eukprot:1112529-Rhodomonas_salina.2
MQAGAASIAQEFEAREQERAQREDSAQGRDLELGPRHGAGVEVVLELVPRQHSRLPHRDDRVRRLRLLAPHRRRLHQQKLALTDTQPACRGCADQRHASSATTPSKPKRMQT